MTTGKPSMTATPEVVSKGPWTEAAPAAEDNAHPLPQAFQDVTLETPPKLEPTHSEEENTAVAPAVETVVEEASDDIDSHREWPSAFYCHRTRALMTDPVVSPDGHSIERSALQGEEGNNVPYYPNRALQAIMEETMAQDSIRASLKSIQKSVSHGLSYLLPESTIASEPLFRPLNDALYCPITFNLMHQPVIDPEGNTFEKVAIENWIRVNRNSPITRTELRTDQLYPNLAIQQLLQAEAQKPEDEMHPAVRKWKDEPAPTAADVELGGNLQTPSAEPTIIVVTARGNAYPTTPSEWARREHARRRAIYNFFGLFFAGVCLVGFILYGSIFFLLLFVLTVLLLFSRRYQQYSVDSSQQQQQQPQRQ